MRGFSKLVTTASKRLAKWSVGCWILVITTVGAWLAESPVIVEYEAVVKEEGKG